MVVVCSVSVCYFASCEEKTCILGKVVGYEIFYQSLEAEVMYSADTAALLSKDFDYFTQSIPSNWKSRKKYKLPAAAERVKMTLKEKLSYKSTNTFNFEVFKMLIVSLVPPAV